MNSPELGRFEVEPAVSKIERHQLCAELEGTRAEIARSEATAEVAKNPELLAMLAKLNESGPELSADVKAHIRRMIALSYTFYASTQRARNAEIDQAFHDTVVDTVKAELEELANLLVDDTLPDMWDIAYDDLLRLEENDE